MTQKRRCNLEMRKYKYNENLFTYEQIKFLMKRKYGSEYREKLDMITRFPAIETINRSCLKCSRPFEEKVNTSECVAFVKTQKSGRRMSMLSFEMRLGRGGEVFLMKMTFIAITIILWFVWLAK